ncbi:uncharacterized protein LOC101736896 [Bombyx mori]|uniref:MD-2-related lipid-recognition protein 3 n=1 Tax=Bombyx mori TaxID=7091 RepID=A0A6G7K3Z9_BOMMO|nr:uncharacterized protein LOC101736896 [Bombyx mori]QII57786.1 MD-2-related lipid-recognition protein 3 [Bombyx mori]
MTVLVRLYSVTFLCLWTIVVIQGTDVDKCSKGKGPLPASVELVGCEKPRCKLRRGQIATLNLKFNAPHAIRHMHTKASAKAYLALFFPVTYKLELGDMEKTCQFLTNTKCPIPSGQEVHFSLEILIEDDFPKNQQLTVEFIIEDQDNKPLICAELPIVIV